MKNNRKFKTDKDHTDNDKRNRFVKIIEGMGIPYQNSISIFEGNMLELNEQNSLIGLA